MSRRIGILGGTFDPIHQGHLDLGASAQAALRLDTILVIPSNAPVHRHPPAASAFHRFAMVSLAISTRPGWQASDLELELAGRSYTSVTLHTLHQRGYRASELFFIIGADAFAEIATWKDYPALLDLASFAVVSRPGHPVGTVKESLPDLAPRMIEPGVSNDGRGGTSIILIESRTTDVSSTAIRQRVAAVESIAGLVPAIVQQHIERHALYASPQPGRREGEDERNPAAGRLHGQS